MRGLMLVLALALFGVGGWIIGSVYPAPSGLVAMVGPQALERRAADGLRGIDWSSVRALLSPEQLAGLTQEAVEEKAAAGQVIVIEEAAPDVVQEATPEGAPSILQASATSFPGELALCPGMSISNAPRADAARKVLSYKPTVKIEGVDIALAPTSDACLSSGFGPRSGRTHKGIDLHNPNGGPILAGGDGVVLEKKYRDDYGNMILIDHGNGVYTRYAHLSAFQRGLAVGAKVKAGDQIGLMGNTASYSIPVHLHYEVLSGDYNTPKASFGLTPVDPFRFTTTG